MATLAALPPELLLLISESLPSVDLDCFSVCDHRLYKLLSRQTNPSPRLAPDDKFSILTRLERDLPSYFACKICNLLHWYDGSENFGLSGYNSDRTCHLPCVKYNSGKHWFSIHHVLAVHQHHSISINEFSFLHLKLAMRRFYYGPEAGISTDSLSHTQVTEGYMVPYKDKIIWLFSQDAQICTKPLGLFLRLQDIVLFSEWRFLIQKASRWDPLIFCQHRTVRHAITPVLRSLGTNETVSLDDKEFHAHCSVCNTVCDIEFSDFESKKALIITRWVNLGPGLDEKDPLWKSHASALKSHRRYCGFIPNHPHEAQDPKECFEEATSQSIKDLRLRNLSYLKDGGYRKIMRYESRSSTWERRIWHSPSIQKNLPKQNH